ncbi:MULTISPECIES: histidine kinase dimerization/phosphoacceptor domain -containing protein [unclassified Leptospira]|uniref:histidine kinase dimerization/phosphoacceptor domain -containing protein n=1 Tax=unclassified Leptospira TaxID=2633828 RepID=UPI001E3F85D6|nr:MULTISPECIES: histidine kinase dimerization/phosphoacceptor domain -containing protein [unclassified Leptospira]
MLSRSLKYVQSTAIVFLVASVYFLLGKFGESFGNFSDYASPIWPASGWGLVTPLLFGKVSFFGIFTGSFLYNCQIRHENFPGQELNVYFWAAILIACGSTLQSFTGTYLYKKFIPQLDLTKNPSFVLKFLWIETFVCIIAATIACSGLLLLGIIDLNSLFPTWIIWWMGDSLGVFVYFPFFLSWLGPGVARFRVHSWKESAGLVSFLILLGAGIFYFFTINKVPAYFPLSYLLIAVISLVSLRFGGRESSLVLIIVSFVAIIGTAQGHSYNFPASKEVSLLLLQSFLSAISIASLLALAVVKERMDTEEKLFLSHQKLEKLVAERTQELDRSYRFLGASEAIYKGLFENVPIAILECDYSKVRRMLGELPRMSKKEFTKFLKTNPKFVSECYETVSVVDANKESVRLFESSSKEEVLFLARNFFRKGNDHYFKKLLTRIHFGARVLHTEVTLSTCSGKQFEASIRWSLAPEFEETFSSTIVTVAEITDKKQAERQLKSSLKEKEVMLKEIHHRVKNNLQVISSLFSLQSEYENDPKIHEAFAESQNRIQTMALIHDELYQSNDLGNVEFSGYSRRLVEKIRTAYKIGAETRVDVISSPIHLEISIAIPLGLALNELLTNSFKYAFPQNYSPSDGRPKIQVKLQKIEKIVLLEVSDNGIGLPNELDPIATHSFGLTLVQVLTKQLKGKLDFSSSKNQGANFQIRFELPN